MLNNLPSDNKHVYINKPLINTSLKNTLYSVYPMISNLSKADIDNMHNNIRYNPRHTKSLEKELIRLSDKLQLNVEKTADLNHYINVLNEQIIQDLSSLSKKKEISNNTNKAVKEFCEQFPTKQGDINLDKYKVYCNDLKEKHAILQKYKQHYTDEKAHEILPLMMESYKTLIEISKNLTLVNKNYIHYLSSLISGLMVFVISNKYRKNRDMQQAIIAFLVILQSYNVGKPSHDITSRVERLQNLTLILLSVANINTNLFFALQTKLIELNVTNNISYIERLSELIFKIPNIAIEDRQKIANYIYRVQKQFYYLNKYQYTINFTYFLQFTLNENDEAKKILIDFLNSPPPENTYESYSYEVDLAKNNLAYLYLLQENYAEAFFLYKQITSIKHNISSALYWFGHMYENGYGTEVNKNFANFMYERAGNSFRQNIMFRCSIEQILSKKQYDIYGNLIQDDELLAIKNLIEKQYLTVNKPKSLSIIDNKNSKKLYHLSKNMLNKNFSVPIIIQPIDNALEQEEIIASITEQLSLLDEEQLNFFKSIFKDISRTATKELKFEQIIQTLNKNNIYINIDYLKKIINSNTHIALAEVLKTLQSCYSI